MLLIGDCFKKIDEIDRKSVQAIVTSPPYWGLRDYQKDGQLGEEPTPEEFVQRLIAAIHHDRRQFSPDSLGTNSDPNTTTDTYDASPVSKRRDFYYVKINGVIPGK